MVLKLRSRESGREYDCLVQSVNLNSEGYWALRYAIGTMGRLGYLCYIEEYVYDNVEFNRKYEVIDHD